MGAHSGNTTSHFDPARPREGHAIRSSGDTPNRTAGTAGPIVSQRRLRTALRGIRLQRGHTLEYVAAAMEWSISKTVRIETGTVTISPSDLKVLLDLYAVTGEVRRNELLQLAKQARRRTWTSQYRDRAPAGFLELAEYEAEARRICQYHPIVVPELLRTAAYAQALSVACEIHQRPEHPESAPEALAERQRWAVRDDGPELVFAVDESAFARPIAGPANHRAQIDHLLAVNENPRVRLVAIPNRAGYPGPGVAFTLVEFGDSEDPAVAYVDSLGGPRPVQVDREVAGYQRAFGRLLGVAVEATPILEQLRRQL